MQELVASLLLWISVNSALIVPHATPPSVKVVAKYELEHILFDGDVPPALASGDLRVEGAYIHDERAIYLAEDVDVDEIAGRSVLVHELVHFVQLAGDIGHSVHCERELEADAYRIQALYLVQHGEAPAFSAEHIASASRCR